MPQLAQILQKNAQYNIPTLLFGVSYALQLDPLSRLREMVADLKTGPALDLAMLSVAMRELRSLT